MVIAKQKKRVVPERPDETGDERGRCKAVPFGKLRHEKASPADFFSEDSRKIHNDADRCREEEVEGDREPRRHRPEPEVLRDKVHEMLVVKAPEPGKPDERVAGGSICEWDQVANDLVTGLAPFPTE